MILRCTDELAEHVYSLISLTQECRIGDYLRMAACYRTSSEQCVRRTPDLLDKAVAWRRKYLLLSKMLRCPSTLTLRICSNRSMAIVHATGMPEPLVVGYRLPHTCDDHGYLHTRIGVTQGAAAQFCDVTTHKSLA